MPKNNKKNNERTTKTLVVSTTDMTQEQLVNQARNGDHQAIADRMIKQQSRDGSISTIQVLMNKKVSTTPNNNAFPAMINAQEAPLTYCGLNYGRLFTSLQQSTASSTAGASETNSPKRV